MKSIGVDLAPWVKKGLLHLESSRPTLHGIEMHLATIHKKVNDFKPQVVIIDPISNFATAGTPAEAEAMLLRLIDFLKSRQITAMFVNLTAGGNAWEKTDVGVSSLIDTWILLRDIELAGERNRGIYVLKSRGMKHSNQIREFVITAEGIRLEDVYVGPEGVLTGSMRAAQEDRERAAAQARGQEMERKQRDLARRRAALEAQITALRAEFEAVEDESKVVAEQDRLREQQISESRSAAAVRRGAENNSAAKGKRK
jgi:circadian clock protein KaiC